MAPLVMANPRQPTRLMPVWSGIAIAAAGALASALLVKTCAGWFEAPYQSKTEAAAQAKTNDEAHTALKEVDAKLLGTVTQINLTLQAMDQKLDERLPPKKGRTK